MEHTLSVKEMGKIAKEASYKLKKLKTKEKNAMLLEIKKALLDEKENILRAMKRISRRAEKIICQKA